MSAAGGMTVAEMQEFATFRPSAQRYIRRSLQIVRDPATAPDRFARDIVEAVKIKAQVRVYERMDEIRERVPRDSGLDGVEPFMAPLVAVTAFDLAQEALASFSAYRFLYERLLGASVRPWLPGAFCAAAALPHIPPAQRRDLLQTISENAATAPGWSTREPSFYPEWIDKDDEGVRAIN